MIAWKKCVDCWWKVRIGVKKVFARLFVWVKNTWLPLMICAVFLLGAVVLCVCLLCPKVSGNINTWGTVVGIVAGVATIVSLAFVYETLRRTRIVAEAQLLSDFNDKYFDPDMAASIRCLHKFKKKHKANFEVHRTPRQNPSAAMQFTVDDKLQWTHETDESRRRVKAYFLSVTELYEHGMISLSIFEKMIDKNGITALFDIVEPLEWYLNEGYNAKIFSRLMRYIPHLYEKYDSAKEEFDERQSSRVIEPFPAMHDGIQNFLVSVESLPLATHRHLYQIPQCERSRQHSEGG